MKFLIGFLVTIGLLIVVFILIFRGAANNDRKVQEAPKLVDYSTSSTVMQFTQKGPVASGENHDELRITVSNVETAVEIFSGYEGNLIASRTYPNNSTAYADFLRALDLANFEKGKTDKALQDERGVCSTGSRYIMSIKDGDKQIQRFWATDCDTTQSFSGNTKSVIRLFKAQVPDYSKFVGSVKDLNL